MLASRHRQLNQLANYLAAQLAYVGYKHVSTITMNHKRLTGLDG